MAEPRQEHVATGTGVHAVTWNKYYRLWHESPGKYRYVSKTI